MSLSQQWRGGQSCALMTPAAVSGMGRTGDLLEVAALLRDDVYLGEWQQAWRGGKRCERIFKDVERTEGQMT